MSEIKTSLSKSFQILEEKSCFKSLLGKKKTGAMQSCMLIFNEKPGMKPCRNFGLRFRNIAYMSSWKSSKEGDLLLFARTYSTKFIILSINIQFLAEISLW